MARILIDALGADSPGARRHLEGFLPALARAAGAHQFELVVRQSAAAALPGAANGPIGLRPVPDAIARPVLTRLLYDVAYLPWHARRAGFDAVVTLANFGPVWTPVPHVVFQRNAMHFSEEYLGRVGRLLRWNWKLRGLLSVAEMRYAAINVTPTQAMAALIRTTHPSLSSKRFVTLPHGVDLSRFRRREGQARKPGPVVLLYPTKIEAYKGLEVLLEATRLLAAERADFEVRLTTADRGWPASLQAAIEAARGQAWFRRLRFIGSQSADDMPAVYADTDAVVYCSLCESFGFPLLEAMACGLPIVAADLDVNRELCGDAPLYYAAKSAAACAEAMRHVLAGPTRRRELGQASAARIQARDWSWEGYARRFVEICEMALY